jgi:phosphoribosylpyrophosphate synthetase
LALNNDSIVDKLIESPIVKILATNSHPMAMCERVKSSDKFVILDVSPVFARTIQDHLLME